MAIPPNVTILPDAPALARAAADHFARTVQGALRRRKIVHVALAGGSTPRAVNALLVSEPLRRTVDWARVVFWFGDERCVPPDDDDSNYKMNRETLLGPLGIAPERVHRMRGEDDPAAAAAVYDALLQRDLGTQPRLDLIMLGMGPDGHTASMFPGTIAALDNDKRCVAHIVPKLAAWRITLTPRTINAAQAIIFTAGGAEKAASLAAVLEGPRAPDVYPSQLIDPPSGTLHWFVDAPAAAQLHDHPTSR